MSNLAYGTLTITNLSEVTSVDVWYCKSSSPTQLTNNNWQTTTPTWEEGYYIWSKTVTTWAENDTPTESRPVCITGQRGNTGNTGQSVVSITQQYALSTSSDNAPTTGWSTNMPAFETGKYYWTRSEIVWANPTNTTHTTAVLANGITSANTTAASAVSTANSANSKADTAISTANSANQQAQRATSIANGKNTIYYSSSFPTGGTYKQGDTLFKEGASGYVIYEYNQTDNQWVKKSLDEDGITQITNAKIANLDGGKINAGTITALKLATDAIKSRDYVAGTAPYSGAGTLLDLTHGNIFTKNFGVNNTTDNIANGAYIKGSIQAYEGRIGSNTNNYWYIGDYYDYGQNSSAYIKGNGTATIQLGDSNAWRLNTNRIHTAWNDDVNSTVGQLHYLNFNSKYWDLGFHVPSSSSDKFIYIRKSKTNGQSNELELLQDNLDDNLDGTNNYWSYQFYVTSDGSLYAKNLYILNENGNPTAIGGTDGVYLLKSGGTITGDLTVNGTLTATASQANALTHTLSINGQSWTGSSNLTINTLGTAYGGTGNTSYTTGGVVYVDGSNPKKLLSTAAGTSGYLLKSGGAGAPTWVDPGTLTVAAAAKDGDGNVIKTTYLKLTGGNVTGPVSFGDSVSIDDLNAGNLVVTGNASFTNNIQANTINGVTVGSSPKFTDTVTTISTEGNGNAITAIESTNGTLKAIKGATFLMSINSSQVISALGYTPYNATNPNGYTTNTGTVTSVRVQANSPLQSSVNTAQNSSLNTTISFINQNANVVLAGPSSGSAAAPTFRALVAADIPTLTKSKISDFPTTWALSSITGADDLKAIEALTGTSGFLKKTAANTWSLDTNTYLTTHQTVTDKNPTLAWGTQSAVATIGSTTINVTMPANPNYTANLITGASNSAKTTAAAADGSVFLNLIENNTVRNYHNLKGGNGLTITSDTNGVVTFTSPAAFTGVSFDNGKLTFTKSDGNSAELTTDSFVITQAAGATGLVDSSGTGLNVGGATTKPVYFNNGIPVEVTSIPYTLLSGAPSSMTPASHTHGNIQNGGTLQTNDITIANGDKLIVTDASDSNKIARTSISFDGSTATKALTQKGTWETFNNYSLPLAANNTRGGVKIGYTTSNENRNYAVQLSNQQMYVNVPWNAYSAGTGLSLSGTTFNHSNSITAGTAGTSSATSSTNRTIAIPYLTYDAQGHITGSGTHTHTLDAFPEAYLSWGGKNFSAWYGPIDAAMIEELGANRFAFFKAAGITIEYTRDGGSTWIDYGATDWQKVGLFSSGCSFTIGKADSNNKATAHGSDYQLRITLDTGLGGVYSVLNKFAIYISTSGSSYNSVTIEKALQSTPTTYITQVADVPISGWSGWNIINVDGITTYGNTPSSQYGRLRFIFKANGGNTNYSGLTINKIKAFGGQGWSTPSNLAATGHLYSYDASQNATFPAQVTATQFNGKLNGNATTATSAEALTNKTLDSLTLNSTAGTFSFQGNNTPWDGTDWVGLQVGSNDDKFQIHALNGTTLEYRQNDSGGTNSNWGDWYSLLSAGNYTDYTVTKTGTGASGTWGISITGNAVTATSATSAVSATSATRTGNSAIWLYAHNNNEINFGGTNDGTAIYVGYRAIESRPIPTKFIFGGSTGTADLQVKTVYLGSGTTSYITSTQYTGTATKAIQDGNGNVITTKYVTIDTEQTISNHKTFSNLVTFKEGTGSEYCNINYNQSLGALVFSFG